MTAHIFSSVKSVERYELEAWLGPVLSDLTPEQVDSLLAEAQEIHDRYTDVDDWEMRDAELVTAMERLLGDR